MPRGSIPVSEEKTSLAYAKRVGERLRAIRKQKDLSLQDVEQASREEFKASVLGAYERGERAISVPRLQRLAALYEVPVDQLLPDRGTPGAPVAQRTPREHGRRRGIVALTKMKGAHGALGVA